MMVRREMPRAHDKREERERRDGRDGRRLEVRSPRFPEPQTPNFESRFFRPSRLSQASAIAAEAFMNNAGAAFVLGGYLVRCRGLFA